MAKGWKRVAETVLAGSGLAGALRRSRSPTTAILAYHNIIPHGENVVGDSSLHVDQQTFADQLDFVLETHTVVPLSDLSDPTEEEPSHRVVVTFDDAYRGTVTAGLEELGRRGLPGTIFVPPGLLGSDGFWWDMLAPEGDAPLEPEVRDHALDALRGMQYEILAWASTESVPSRPLPAHAQPSAESELLEAAKAEGITLGAHTWSHANLTRITPEEADAEHEKTEGWLQDKAPEYTPWLAYPYGLHDDVVVSTAASRFSGSLKIDGGLAQTGGEWVGRPQRMPRINVPRGITLHGLALRLAGLLA